MEELVFTWISGLEIRSLFQGPAWLMVAQCLLRPTEPSSFFITAAWPGRSIHWARLNFVDLLQEQ